MATKVPRISEAEWVVMKQLWAASPATANAVVESLAGTVRWSPKTIRTLLNRLVQKKALGYKKEGREYLYHPLIKEDAYVRAESRSFLQRVYGGAVTPMLAAFLESEELSAADLTELKQILERKKRG
jgi:BlaI family transcriptional regulator, penicillinase repressor